MTDVFTVMQANLEAQIQATVEWQDYVETL
jgi:hypothetical protein